MTLYISLTNEDIEAGVVDDCRNCPVARASQRAMPGSEVVVEEGRLPMTSPREIRRDDGDRHRQQQLEHGPLVGAGVRGNGAGRELGLPQIAHDVSRNGRQNRRRTRRRARGRRPRHRRAETAQVGPAAARPPSSRRHCAVST